MEIACCGNHCAAGSLLHEDLDREVEEASAVVRSTTHPQAEVDHAWTIPSGLEDEFQSLEHLHRVAVEELVLEPGLLLVVEVDEDQVGLRGDALDAGAQAASRCDVEDVGAVRLRPELVADRLMINLLETLAARGARQGAVDGVDRGIDLVRPIHLAVADLVVSKARALLVPERQQASPAVRASEVVMGEGAAVVDDADDRPPGLRRPPAVAVAGRAGLPFPGE